MIQKAHDIHTEAVLNLIALRKQLNELSKIARRLQTERVKNPSATQIVVESLEVSSKNFAVLVCDLGYIPTRLPHGKTRISW